MKKCEVNNICSSWLFRIVLTAQNGLKRITDAFILKAAAVRVFEKCVSDCENVIVFKHKQNALK